jgi:hypothetical protein
MADPCITLVKIRENDPQRDELGTVVLLTCARNRTSWLRTKCITPRSSPPATTWSSPEILTAGAYQFHHGTFVFFSGASEISPPTSLDLTYVRWKRTVFPNSRPALSG